MQTELKTCGFSAPQGIVTVSGAKNSATRLLAAALIADEPVTLQNFPTKLLDVKHKASFIEAMGGSVKIDHATEEVTIDSASISNVELNDYIVPIRTTYLLAGGLLKKNGIARIPYPEGCKIGERKYDLHIMVWENFGAVVEEKKDFIEIRLKDQLKPAEIHFPINTIGGTENALICAATIDGETTIKNAYISPEIEDLITFLKSLGVDINTDGNSFIKVIGRNYLRGTNHQVMPDRIEALTWLIYGIVTRGNITIRNVPFEKMKIPLIQIKECGIDFYQNDEGIIIRPDCLKNNTIQPFEIATGTHPGIISDMQPFFTLLGLFADGYSTIHDYRYPDRIAYCEELEKLFPNSINYSRGRINTSGAVQTTSSNEEITLHSKDLRGSMAILLAALSQNRPAIIKNAENCLRGYNNLIPKLSQLGIKIEVH